MQIYVLISAVSVISCVTILCLTVFSSLFLSLHASHSCDVVRSLNAVLNHHRNKRFISDTDFSERIKNSHSVSEYGPEPIRTAREH